MARLFAHPSYSIGEDEPGDYSNRDCKPALDPTMLRDPTLAHIGAVRGWHLLSRRHFCLCCRQAQLLRPPVTGSLRAKPLQRRAGSRCLLQVKLLKNPTLKLYPDFPHGMLTTYSETINKDLLEFIKG